jgi:putative lipoic acid-binding regulatory protein
MKTSTKFPGLKILSEEELRALTPDQFSDTLKIVGQIETQLNTKLIQLQTQAEALDRQHAELKSKLQGEFGFSTVEELEALRDEKIHELAELYASLDS